jgi:hypothetical protein
LISICIPPTAFESNVDQLPPEEPWWSTVIGLDTNPIESDGGGYSHKPLSKSLTTSFELPSSSMGKVSEQVCPIGN